MVVVQLKPPLQAVLIQAYMSDFPKPNVTNIWSSLPEFFVRYSTTYAQCSEKHQKLVACLAPNRGSRERMAWNKTTADCHFHDAILRGGRRRGLLGCARMEIFGRLRKASRPNLRYIWHLNGLWLAHSHDLAIKESLR